MKYKIALFIILGIFIVGTLSAIAFGIDKDFKDKVKKLDPNKLCKKEIKMFGEYKNKYCKDNKEKIDVDKNIISITENSEGVIKVKGVG